MDQFTQIFKHDSRLNVVLFRDGWSESRWTAVEAAAIKDSALNTRWESLFVVVLDKGATPPIWVPSTIINMDYIDFGLTETVGAIRKRALERHATFKEESPLELAKRLEKDRADVRRRKDLEFSQAGLDAGLASAKVVIAEAVRLADEIVASLPSKIQFERGIDGASGFVKLGWARLSFWWDPDSISSPMETSTLVITVMKAAMLGPRHHTWPDGGKRYTYQARLSTTDDWVWRDKKRTEYSAAALADFWIQNLVRLAYRD
jgi:hypothetical protein